MTGPIPTITTPPELASGTCVGHTDPDLWFPLTANNAYRRDPDGYATRLCGGCPVTAACLQYALRTEGGVAPYGRHGIYGGTTPETRAAIARRARRNERRRKGAS